MTFLRNNPWFSAALASLPLILGTRTDFFWGLLSLVFVLPVLLAAGLGRILPWGPVLFLPLVMAGSLWSAWSRELTDYLPPGTPEVFEVAISGDPVRRGQGWRMKGRLEGGEDGEGAGAEAQWPVEVYSPIPLLPGSRWRSPGSLNSHSGILFLREPEVLAEPPPWETFRWELREAIRERFRILKPQGAALASALFLGVREDLTSQEGALFRKAGLSHILALSGSHLSLWASFLPWFFLFLPLPWRRTLGVLPVLGFYVWIAGEIPSLQRALLALVLSSLAGRAGIRIKDAEALGAGWLALLTIRPGWFGDPGFLLSFLAMAGLQGPGKLFTLVLSRGPRWLAEGLGASLGAFLTVLPLSLGLFGGVQWSGLVTGIPAGLICAVILVLCGLVLLPIPWAEILTVPLLDLSLEGLMVLCTWGAEVPLWPAAPFWGLVLWALLGLGAVLVYKVRRERTCKLRFPQGHPGTSGLPGIQHPQALGTEFPH